ncbi:hypothetical protein LOD99_13968 [Oopsacas minuta]|uniref:PITH domain-containing protein n=1 Tax=Oopsacas minuta TaxID=111878 RepID=A0AAV7KGE5_9METZ|nr:hypothetical protein LOD99_13968 [Oopsacas minuta]
MACSHGHGGCDHNNPEDGAGDKYSLYLKIDTDKVKCLNESIDGAGKYVFKPWDERLNKEKFVDSDVDEELLFYIPFTGSVKLKSIIIIGGEGGTHPQTLKLFKNAQQVGFDEMSRTHPEQELYLGHDAKGNLEYPLKSSKLSSVESLTLYFSKNYGDESTRIYYIGLNGEFLKARRQEVVITSYELRANPADHKVKDFQPAGSMNVL